MQKYAKLSLLLFIIFNIFLFIPLPVIVYINDPLQVWHKPFFRNPAYAHMRLSARAFIRDYDFDSVIIGNSHFENTSAQKAGEILGGKFFNLSISGSTIAERNLILGYLLKHKKIDKIVYAAGLDYLTLKRENYGYPLNTYNFLYDDNTFNDYRIYLNDKYLPCALSFKKILSCIKTVDADRPYHWDENVAHTGRFGGFENWIKNKNNPQIMDVFKIILSTPLDINNKTLDNKYKRDLYTYLDEDFFKIIKNNPAIKFYVVIPPVSNLQLAMYRRDSNLSFEKYKLRLNYIVSEAVKYPNMEIFAFDKLDSMGKIEDFKDTTHFRTWVNYFILESIAQNKNRILPNNIDEYFKQVCNKAQKVEFNRYYDKVKSIVENELEQ